MARWRDHPAAVPEPLARFIPSEWPGADEDETARAWKAACFQWLDANPGRRLPFGHGGKLDVLREMPGVRAIRQRNEAWRAGQN